MRRRRANDPHRLVTIVRDGPADDPAIAIRPDAARDDPQARRCRDG
jgi:hypothetical protein